MMRFLGGALLASNLLAGAAIAQVYPNYKVSDITMPAGVLPNGATSVAAAIGSAAAAASSAATAATAALPVSKVGVPGYAAALDLSGNLQAPTASVRGGIKSAAAPSNQFQTGVDTGGNPLFAQPSFGNLSGTATAGQLPAATSSVPGAISLTAAAAQAPVQSVVTQTGAITSSELYSALNGTTNGTFYDGALGAAAAATASAAVPFAQVGVANGVAPTDANNVVPSSKVYPTTGYRFIGQNSFIGAEQGFYPIQGGNGETTRVTYTEPYDIDALKLFFPTQSAANGLEINLPNPVFYYGSAEYSPSGASPALSAPVWFTQNAQTTMIAGTQGAGVTTDPLGIYIPASSPFSIRLGSYVARAPATFTAVATAGGSLPVGTYYYKETAVANGVESGPTSEVAVTTTSGNQSVTITDVAPVGSQPVYQTYKIYRGVTSGSEGYLAAILVPGLTYVDNGSIPATIATPPYSTYHTYPLNDTVEGANNSGVAMSTNALYAGGADGFNVGFTGVLPVPGPNSGLISRPYLLGQTSGGFSEMLLADSIGAGFNILPGSTALGTTALYNSWFGLAMSGSGNNDYINASLPSTTCNSMISNGQYGSNTRWNFMQYAQYVWIALGTNDIYSGASTGVQTATCILKLAQLVHETGRRVIVSDLIPRVATTDHMLTLANESIANTSYEGARVFVNTWMRNGFQVLAGVPVTSGGTPCSCVYRFFDEAQAAGEVNSAGVPTVNGGFLPVPATATYTGQVLTGTPTTTSLPIGAASYTAHALSNRVVQITSGSTMGQTAIISDNTATTLTVSGLTSAPAAGATLSIWPTHWSDGIHPTDLGHADIAAGLNGNQGATAFATANLVGF
jgi:hypothetical protein